MKKTVKLAKHVTKEKRKKTGTTANTLWRADQAQMALTENQVSSGDVLLRGKGEELPRRISRWPWQVFVE